MGLSGWLAGQAVAGAHALLVEAPGAWQTRVAVEQALVRRGWRTATAPADADVLVVCGRPGDRLTEAIDRVWAQLPGPRARGVVREVHGVDEALDEAAAVLLDAHGQRAEAVGRPVAAPGADPNGGHGPGGLALASGGPDRDGLEMDVLHLPLGPVLPHWPAGLVLRAALQGDVVTDVEVDWLDTGRASPPEKAPEQSPAQEAVCVQAARRCDGAVDILALAGWDSAAADARRVRDALLAGAAPGHAADLVERLRARVAGSRMLRWSLRDLGVIDDARVERLRLPGDTRGDVHTRLVRLLELTRDQLRDDVAAVPDLDRSGLGAALPHLVMGLDVAATRLVVASLAPFATMRDVAILGGRDG